MDAPSIFNEPTMALASQFPELDPLALLQLVEAPVVRMAFFEFRKYYWDEITSWDENITPRGVLLDSDELKNDLNAFLLKPEGYRGPVGNIGGGPSGSSRRYHMYPFSSFMSRVYSWAVQRHLNLPVRQYLVGTELCVSILWGILGICISLHAREIFPTLSFQLDDHANIETEALGYSPYWFPAWQEWRMRHESLQREGERDVFIRSWASRISIDHSIFTTGSEYSRCENFAKVLWFFQAPQDFFFGPYEAGEITVVPSYLRS
ncbi:hypothetical protein F5Y03DRAFT_410302 [Xylaria venustula]|nr:hypothetical protein F5Y03DRAFT_410302 [Xylaria venustula]